MRSILSVCPSNYSMTMKGRPSCSSISYMVQIFGWFSDEAVRASRSKRGGSLDRWPFRWAQT